MKAKSSLADICPLSPATCVNKASPRSGTTQRYSRQLRDDDNLKGKCGCCEFRHVCMGCRARAYAATGDFLAEEPFCVYEPGTSNQMIRTIADAKRVG